MKAGWQTSTLGDTCELYQPKTISGKELVEDGAYPVFGANGIIGRYDKFNHEEPQLLITCRGATCGSVNISEPKSWITGNAMVVRPKDVSIEMKFLEYLFRGGLDISKAITGAAQPQITRTNLAPLEISYPIDVTEQQRIVGILDEVFDGIATTTANAEQNLQNARALFESHLQSIFTQRGEEWVDTLIGECIRFIDYRGKTPQKTASGLRLITAKNVKMGYVQDEPREFVAPNSYDGWMTRGIPKLGDVLFTTEAPLANVAQLETNEKVVFAQRIIIMQPDASKLDSTFLKYLLLSQPVQQRIHAKGTGATVQGIKASLLKLIEISFPKSISEQKQIVAKFDALSEETQRLESLYQRKLAALDELKKSLLHQAFSGAL
jgi:type I restriction enzyme S subunit